MRNPTLILAALSLLLISPELAAASPLVLSPCQLEHPVRLTVVPAECGELRVPEDPDSPDGRRIELHVARVPAISRRRLPDPLFVLAGGPGMAATAFYATVAPAFERIHRDRDIVLVDQRGTGRSNPLSCELDDDALYREGAAEVASETERCLKGLRARAQVALYTTSIAVRDLDQVRTALGYAQINLYGASYGTRVAQHYARRYPRQTRSLILDGVVPPELALGPDTALGAEAALKNILVRCAHDADCSHRFGDPTAGYHTLRQRLHAHPVAVSLADPTTGEAAQFDFTPYHLATVLRLASYTPEQAALLPLLLHDASEYGNFGPLAAQFLLVSRSYGDVVAYGMHNSVVCTEDVPFYDLKSIDRAQLETTYLGTTQLDGLLSICKLWPHGRIDEDFHAPLRSEVPALLLSGSNDPVTPPAFGERAQRGFAHSLHLVLEGFGHGQLVAPCIDRVMALFVERASVEGLDTSCTRDAKPMPFFTSHNGPSP